MQQMPNLYCWYLNLHHSVIQYLLVGLLWLLVACWREMVIICSQNHSSVLYSIIWGEKFIFYTFFHLQLIILSLILYKNWFILLFAVKIYTLNFSLWKLQNINKFLVFQIISIMLYKNEQVERKKKKSENDSSITKWSSKCLVLDLPHISLSS